MVGNPPGLGMSTVKLLRGYGSRTWRVSKGPRGWQVIEGRRFGACVSVSIVGIYRTHRTALAVAVDRADQDRGSA